jgi:hypothetical protein
MVPFGCWVVAGQMGLNFSLKDCCAHHRERPIKREQKKTTNLIVTRKIPKLHKLASCRVQFKKSKANSASIISNLRSHRTTEITSKAHQTVNFSSIYFARCRFLPRYWTHTRLICLIKLQSTMQKFFKHIWAKLAWNFLVNKVEEEGGGLRVLHLKPNTAKES